jgi:transcriptional regulator with XRE-family HTH domain
MKRKKTEEKVSVTEFGKRIAQLRQENQQTMTDLADKVGVSEAYISLLESGKRHPSRKIVEKLVVNFSPMGSPLLRDQLLILAGYDPHSNAKAAPHSHLEKLLQGTPSDSFSTFMALVNSLIRQRQFALAQARIGEGFKFFQKTVQLQMLVAYLELTKGNHDAAIVAMEAALQFKALNPASESTESELLLNLGVLYFFKGSARLTLLRDAQARTHPEEIALFREQALEAFFKARETFARGLQVDPQNTNLLDEAARLAFNLADLLESEAASQYWNESILAFEQVLAAPNKDSLDEQALLESSCFLAHAYTKTGKFSQARKALDIITACQPRYAFGYYVLACHCALFAASTVSETAYEQALLFLKKALKLNPDLRMQVWLEPDLLSLREHRAQELKQLL